MKKKNSFRGGEQKPKPGGVGQGMTPNPTAKKQKGHPQPHWATARKSAPVSKGSPEDLKRAVLTMKAMIALQEGDYRTAFKFHEASLA